VNVVVHVTIARRALQPGGAHQLGRLPPAQLAAVDQTAVLPSSCHSGPRLQVRHRGGIGLLEDLAETSVALVPPGRCRQIARSARPGCVFPDRAMQQAD
jgi:hypothetical protein